MIKELRKAITNRSKLRNKLLKTRKEKSIKKAFQSFNLQRIVCEKLKDVFGGNYTIEFSPTIENFGKMSVLSSRRRLFWGSSRNFLKDFSKLVENLDIDEHRNTIDDIETLANNITSSDITDPVLMLLKSTNIIRVKKLNISWTAKI